MSEITYNSNYYKTVSDLIDEFVDEIKGMGNDNDWMILQIYQQKLELYENGVSVGYKNSILQMKEIIDSLY